jgi:hypothetical protein
LQLARRTCPGPSLGRRLRARACSQKTGGAGRGLATRHGMGRLGLARTCLRAGLTGRVGRRVRRRCCAVAGYGRSGNRRRCVRATHGSIPLTRLGASLGPRVGRRVGGRARACMRGVEWRVGTVPLLSAHEPPYSPVDVPVCDGVPVCVPVTAGGEGRERVTALRMPSHQATARLTRASLSRRLGASLGGGRRLAGRLRPRAGLRARLRGRDR